MTDVNDVDPSYGQDSYFALVDEDATVNDAVVTATCTDDGTTLSYRYKHTTIQWRMQDITGAPTSKLGREHVVWPENCMNRSMKKNGLAGERTSKFAHVDPPLLLIPLF